MKIEFNRVTWYSKILALALFIALPFLGFFAGTYYQKLTTPPNEIFVTDSPVVNKPQNSTSSSNTSTKIKITNNRMSITATFSGGVLKYSGTVELPNPCYELVDQTQVTKTQPQVVNINLKTQLKVGNAGQACVQMIVEQPFSGQVTAAANATINVYLNDQLVK